MRCLAAILVLFSGALALGQTFTSQHAGPVTNNRSDCIVRKDPGGCTLVWEFIGDDAPNTGVASVLTPFVYGWIRSVSIAPATQTAPFDGPTVGRAYSVVSYLNETGYSSTATVAVTDNTGVGVTAYWSPSASTFYMASPLYLTVTGANADDTGVAGVFTVVLEY